MKEMILVCDHCRVSIPAVASISVSNGKGKPINLDLCKKHQQEVYKLLMPKHKDSSVSRGTPISSDEWDGLLVSTLKHVTKVGSTTPKAISQETGLPRWRVTELLQELVKDKKLTKTGVGRSIKYQKGK
jgi:hypothetical protein